MNDRFFYNALNCRYSMFYMESCHSKTVGKSGKETVLYSVIAFCQINKQKSTFLDVHKQSIFLNGVWITRIYIV